MKSKNISIFWMALLFYPLLYLLSSFNLFFIDSVFSSIIFLIIAEATIFTGSGISYVLYQTNIGRNWKITVMQIIMAITPFYIIHFFISEKYTVFLIAEAFIFFIGAKLYALSLDKIVHGSYYVFSLGGYFVAGGLIKKYFPDKYHPLFLYIILLLSSCIFMFLKNKVNIKALMKSRNYNEKYLSRYSKKYNNRFVAILCLFFSVALLLRKAVAFIYHIIGQIIKAILKYLIRPTPDMELDEPDKIEQENQLTDNIIKNDNNLLRIILTVIIVIIIIIFIKKYHDVISDIVKHIYLYFRKRIRYLFTKKSEHIQNIGFVDTVEDLSTEKSIKNDKPVSQKKVWKKNLNRYNSMGKGKEKYRFGYGLILSWLDISGKNKKASETVNETAARINSSSFTKLTEAYNPIRYGNNDCNDQNISQLDNTLNNLRDTIN